jgi:hypothetical protein
MFNRFYGDNVLIMIEQLCIEVWDANLVSLFKITNLFVYKKSLIFLFKYTTIPFMSILYIHAHVHFNNSYHPCVHTIHLFKCLS